MARIFISYRRRDTGGYAGRLYDRLALRFGDDNVFMDTGNVPVGQDFITVIEQYISTCDAFLAVIGPDWWEEAGGSLRILNQDDPVRIEISTALTREKRVIPVLVATAEVPVREKLPPEIQAFVSRQAARLTQERFREDVDRLAETLGAPGLRPGRTEEEPRSAAIRYDSAIKDLLRVRDAFHAHLLRKQNVIGTAIGRFLVRKAEAWPTERAGGRQSTRALREPRTLENSEVRPYSQPCVLVFVSRWSTDFSDPGQAIEHVLEMSDGGRVPTCVVLVPTEQPNAAEPRLFSNGPVGGGCFVTSDYQGAQRAATLGCLAKDETALYALTSLTAVGYEGRPVTTILDSRRVTIGNSSMKHAGGFPVSDVYPGLCDVQATLQLDAGLVLLDDVNSATSQIIGVGDVGPLATHNIAATGLDLIGEPVTSFGCASGRMSGRIDAFFYRFQTDDGSESIAEVLIGPGSDRTRTQPAMALAGDAGAVWVVRKTDVDGPPRPVACTLAGQRLDGNVVRFTLAASLGTVTRLLNVSIVREWHAGLPAEWASIRTATDRRGDRNAEPAEPRAGSKPKKKRR